VDVGEEGRDPDAGDVGSAFFARGITTGRSEGSTEFRSGEPDHAGAESGIGGGEGIVDGPATGAGDTTGTATGGVPGVSGTWWWRPAADEREGERESRGPLGVDADGRVWCPRATRRGIGGAAGGSGRRVGIRMRVLREGLGDDE
jgi:hypothetical protein